MKKCPLAFVFVLSFLLFALAVSSQAPTDPEDLVRWKFRTEEAIYASPLVSEGILYIGSMDSTFYAIDARNGKEKWQYHSDASIQSTATAYENLVIFESGNRLLALTNRGKIKWQRNLYDGEMINQIDPWDYHHSSPYLHKGIIYIGTEQGILLGIEAKSGRQVLRCQTLTGQTIRTTPVVSDNLVFYGDWDGVLYANDISNGSLAWKFDTRTDGTYPWPNSILSSLVAQQGQLYFAGKSNRLYSLDALTGNKNWHYSSPTDQWLIGGPVLAEGVIYLGSSDQHLFHAIDAQSGNLIWSTGLDGRIWGRALIQDGLVYIGSNSLFTLEKTSGKILRKFEFPSVHEERKFGDYSDRSANFHSSPVLFEDLVILGSDDGHIYAIEAL